MSKCLRIGHRGACGYEPENTLSSFQKALELKVAMIELDVQLCKTGEAVVFHDSTVDRTTNGKGYLAGKTFHELRKLDAGEGERIPLLQEALDLVNNRVIVNIELKGKGTAIPVSRMVGEYIDMKGWRRENLLISSFNRHELMEVRKWCPNLNIGINITSFKSGLIDLAKELAACSIHPSLKSTKEELVDEIHRQGMKVFVWTVNEGKDIERMKEMGVDGLFSDFPDRI